MPQDSTSLPPAPIACPIYQPAPYGPTGMPVYRTPCPESEIVAVSSFLESNCRISETVSFPRGTVTADGRLDLCKQDIGPGGCDKIIQSLRHNTQIRSLLLGTDGIGDVGARSVAGLLEQHPRLEIAYLGCNGITAAGAENLAQAVSENQVLSGLWLKRNPIGPEGAVALAQMLRTNTQLRVLDLVNTQIGFSGLEALTRALIEQNATLERLHLGGNQFAPVEAELLAELLTKNRTLKVLQIDVNLLGDAGVRLIAAALQHNSVLRHLDLASNGMTAEGATDLFDAVAKHPSLTHISVGFSASTKVLGSQANYVGDCGAKSAASLLRSNSQLRSLDLTRTSIGNQGRQDLCEAIRENMTLVRLQIDGPVPEEFRRRLKENSNSNPPMSLVPDELRLIRSIYR
ncbi:MAG: ribonuclease inhibitor [Planctomycetota bacterium]